MQIMTSRGEIFQVVTQRVSACRLLINEDRDEWVESKRFGLVLYVSFVTTGPDDNTTSCIDSSRLAKGIKSLMTSKLASSSGWKTDHSDAQSIVSLVDSMIPSSIIIIPQATLTGRLIPGDKYLKYHRQVNKERSLELFNQVIKGVAEYFNPNCGCIDSNHGGKIEVTPSIDVLYGSYGKRQGWEMKSTGPSTHYFEF